MFGTVIPEQRAGNHFLCPKTWQSRSVTPIYGVSGPVPLSWLVAVSHRAVPGEVKGHSIAPAPAPERASSIPEVASFSQNI